MRIPVAAAVAAVVLVACAAEQAPPKERVTLEGIETLEMLPGATPEYPAEGNVFAVARLTEDPPPAEARDIIGAKLVDWDGNEYDPRSSSTGMGSSSESAFFGFGSKTKQHPHKISIVFEIPETATPRIVKIPTTLEVMPVPVERYDHGPRVIQRVAPLYPEAARRENEPGLVKLEVFVTAEGRVAGARVIHQEGPYSLGEAAAASVRQWTYTPAVLNGKPVAAMTNVTISFNSEMPPPP